MNLLIKRARKHDKAAFQQLMEQQTGSLYKIARAILKNDEDVADAMQETALACWEKIDTLKKDRYFQTWLTRILINNCNSICRQRARTASGDAIPEAWCQEDGYANVEWESFLNCLEEKYRVIIILYYVQGFKTREIAEILQMNENTVRGRLVNARRQLETQYAGDGSSRQKKPVPHGDSVDRCPPEPVWMRQKSPAGHIISGQAEDRNVSRNPQMKNTDCESAAGLTEHNEKKNFIAIERGV